MYNLETRKGSIKFSNYTQVHKNGGHSKMSFFYSS
jgi:hypothetical protein